MDNNEAKQSSAQPTTPTLDAVGQIIDSQNKAIALLSQQLHDVQVAFLGIMLALEAKEVITVQDTDEAFEQQRLAQEHLFDRGKPLVSPTAGPIENLTEHLKTYHLASDADGSEGEQ
jgi:hypothetical protein